MPRVNVRSGDAGDIPITFQGLTIQEFVEFRNSGTITISPTSCHLYVYDADSGAELIKVPNGTTRDFAVVTGQRYDVLVAGTTDVNPTGSVHYSFV